MNKNEALDVIKRKYKCMNREKRYCVQDCDDCACGYHYNELKEALEVVIRELGGNE